MKIPPIAEISITQNAAKSPAETNPDVSCADFRVTKGHVRRYLTRAKTTTAHDAHYTLDWSPCYATGEVVFADGRRGVWSMDQFRSGSLSIEGADALVLYCPTCRFKPFVW